MSEYTREEILKLIEENGGPEGLDLSGKDLSGIDLGREAIEAELEKVRERAPDGRPVWCSEATTGINLAGANLQGANLGQAKIQGADLRDTRLKRTVFDGAKADQHTIWPEGFQVPEEVLLSECTREEILELIEENGGPEGLDLSGKDLSGIDLGMEEIEAELANGQRLWVITEADRSATTLLLPSEY